MFSLLALAVTASALTSRCDDLRWADKRVHQPVSENNQSYTAQPGYSWHIHYLHYTHEEEAAVQRFQRDFCAAFAKYGKGGSVEPSPWGPNCIADGAKYIYGACAATALATRSNGWTCSNGTCPVGEPPEGPWSTCQNEFYVPAVYIDEVAGWVRAYENLTIPVMRHPNSGCQWGDHSPDSRAEFLGTARVPEMCLWGLPCNSPGYGCVDGMCGALDGTRGHQHAAGCVAEVHS